ncbi:MAG: hypothetical protein IJJ29_00275 [Solobacterium sp.]|nr:hypothetical protein [Solobacterium sp.]
MSELQYIFVHGLSGWGRYDAQYARMPYWGMRNGDLIKHLNDNGYHAYAASVAPRGSAWDRACELYAQLTGTITDYGKAHSEKYGHTRYGKDFSADPLIQVWDKQHPLVLIGHSFGGATIRIFAHLIKQGCEEERACTAAEELSGFFAGGNEERPIKALITLAAPHNGTTAYDLYEDPDFDVNSIHIPWIYRRLSAMMSRGNTPVQDGRDSRDYAPFDMHIDEADRLNRKLSVSSDIYYFSIPCSASVRKPDGTYRPVYKKMEPLFTKSSILMGIYEGRSRGGIPLGKEWQENDGLVNTITAMAPSHQPSCAYTYDMTPAPGIWNILPVYPYDHMSLQGGLMRRHSVTAFYDTLLKKISTL